MSRRRSELDPNRAKLSPDARQALRTAIVAKIPTWYSPIAHLLCPSAIALALIAVAIHFIHDLRAWQLATIPAFFLFANATEWRAHRYALHRRTRFLETLYDRHTPIHHRIFVTEDMAVQDRREWRVVLIPAFGIAAVAGLLLPIIALAALVVGRNVAALAFATSIGYVALYEWMHLSYHMPPDSFVGRRWLIRKLRQHHATHHAPELMQRWNMNVTFPIWDWVRGTVYRPATSESPVPPAPDPASYQSLATDRR